MADLTYFESRSGKTDCTPQQLFNFVSDLRNFERFVPKGSIRGWNATTDSCSFSVSQLGDVRLGIERREEYSLVIYRGIALKNNHFEIILHIDANDYAGVKVGLNAELNPIMKMIASKPITQFLEMVIDRIENFNCREEIE